MSQKVSEKTKEERVKQEKNRLNRLYKAIPENKKKAVAGLIERAAFMRIECEDLEADIKEHGWTEQFRQSEKVEPYERARPQGQTYISLNSNYQKIIKQLSDLLPAKVQQEQDSFDMFLSERDAM